MLVAKGGEKFRRAMSLWLHGTLRGGWFNMQQNWRVARQAEAAAEQEKQATVKTVATSVLPENDSMITLAMATAMTTPLTDLSLSVSVA